MKKQTVDLLCVLGVILLGIMLIIPMFWEKSEQQVFENSSGQQEFSCYTLDSQGNIIQGFKREADGIWYLFVPSTQSISNMVLHYTGNVKKVSDGKLDSDYFTISGAFTTSGDQIELETGEGMIYTVIVMQSNLPSVQIYLNDTTLEEIHADKDVKYGRNTWILTDPDGTYNLTVKNGVEIKGRGNSTWMLYDKKGYQIKFDTQKSILGMEPARKWVLLANASDDSMMRNQLVYRMAENLDMAFVPQFEYVDLWIDGEYLGTYMLGEKVEIENSRLALTQPDGIIFEHDESFYKEEDRWLYSTMMQRHFTLKELAVEEDAIATIAMKDFEKSVDAFASYLYTTPCKEATLDDLSTMIDVDSFAKYYLINEYTLNRESYATSFYWYKDGAGDVLHLGPVWDFDTCMGNDSAGFDESYGEQHVMFRHLLAIPEFKARTEELYEQYQADFAAMASDIAVLEEEIKTSAEMNYLRWDVLGQATLKKDATDFAVSFEEATNTVESWLLGREEHFQIPDCKVIISQVSEDCRTMDLYYEDAGSYDTVFFAVWNTNNGPDTAMWYPAEQIDGVWQSRADLTKFNEAGMYRITVHVDGGLYAPADGRNYVQKAVPPDYKLDVQMTADGSNMEITLQDNAPCEDVYFAVWSEVNSQDDIQWLDADRNSDGIWAYNVDMSMYHDIGTYHIHTYEMGDNPPTFLAGTTIHVEAAVN